MEFLAIVAVILLLILVFRSGGRKHKGLFTKRCPHCRNIIPDKATVCEFCKGDVSNVKW